MHKASAILQRGRFSPSRAGRHDAAQRQACCGHLRCEDGCGKSQTTRRVGQILLQAGLRVALVRHPMPMATSSHESAALRIGADRRVPPSLEERRSTRAGPHGHGDVRRRRLRADPAPAEAECDVVIWTAATTTSLLRPDLQITVVDPCALDTSSPITRRELPTEADVVVVNKIDSPLPRTSPKCWPT